MTTTKSHEEQQGDPLSDGPGVKEVLKIAAYYERKERLRPRRQSSAQEANGEGDEKEEGGGVGGEERPQKLAKTTAQAAAGGRSKGVTASKAPLAIGQRIEVLFDDPPEYFAGTVTGKYKGRYVIEYDDGDREELDLSSKSKRSTYRLLETGKNGSSGSVARTLGAKSSNSTGSRASKSQKGFREGARRSGRVKEVVKAKPEPEGGKAKQQRGSAKGAKKDAKQQAKKKKQENDQVSRLELSNQDEDTLWQSLETVEELVDAAEGGSARKAESSVDIEPWGDEEDFIHPARVEAYRKALRRSWEFAGICHFCRMFSTDLKVKKFSSDQLENALLDPSKNQLFLTELLYRLARDNPYSVPPDAKFYARESTMFMEKWGAELDKRLKSWWFKQYFDVTYTAKGMRRPLEVPREVEQVANGVMEEVGNGALETTADVEMVDADAHVIPVAAQAPEPPAAKMNFMMTTPLDRLLVLHALVEWRIEACPYIREAVDRTVKDAEYGAPALREAPLAMDRHGNRFYYLSQGGEDCRLYAEKPVTVTMKTCLTADTQSLSEFCTPCTTLEDMQSLACALDLEREERRAGQKKQKKALSKQGKSRAVDNFWRKVNEKEEEEGELIRVLKEEIVPHLEETANARKRKEERERLYEMAVKKRSSRIASIHVQKEAEEQKKLEELKRQEELAVERAIAKQEKERERRLEDRRMQMQQALENARRLELEGRISKMLQRQSRWVHRMNMSWFMREVHALNTKSWTEVVQSDLQWSQKKKRAERRGEEDKWVFVETKTRQRVPFSGTSAAGVALENLKAKAVRHTLRVCPGLSDDRVVKLKMHQNNLSKKAMLTTPEEDLQYVNLRLVFHFPRDNSFESVHKRGCQSNIFQ
ncbi:hypothetical protein HOP50_16g77600 [Chloropicon primus]|uniref:PTM/DIR17-like Tudor domain-containing protein n=2 Tax=Chloropicon primus TaxID=1764295 RepID=A0A5B8N0E0_9CHLO|nr:hypothetical protein A3770_16p77320 [Chloropicon primus]UPR04419.1 hypothetical protein HOP50_16g77600 [Chloropicon primus]|eukprot:QDZ25214.1 hypothetical protein A3770_16p77320 [Chloropicon primus]